MFLHKAFVATAVFAAAANAHVTMQSPVPYSVDKLDNGPISKAQFPCKMQNGFTVSTMNSVAVGTKQALQLKGSAIHGGGSCQLSITLDTEPTAASVFKVIKSMEGGCPDKDDATYEFELPASIPNGKATFAWTWFSKFSGAPEMYMNCAPIEVSGGASDKSAFEALPDMLQANLDDTCKSVANNAVLFPDPGSVVQKGSTNDAVAPVGAACGKSTGGSRPAQPAPPAPPAGQPSPPAGQPVPSAGQPGPSTGQPFPPNNGQYTPPAGKPSSAPQSPAIAPPSPGQPSAKPSASAAPPSNPGGVFAPGASSVAGAPALTSTTLVTVTAAPTPTKPSTAPLPGTGPPAQPSAPSSPSTGGGAATSCTTNGDIVCNGEKQFGICNNGKVVWQAVAAGTACTNGVISKRSFNSGVSRPRYRSPRVAMPVAFG